MSLKDLVNDIIEDGVVDAVEVATLRTELYADGVIDREEADALFEINDAVSGNDNDPTWNTFFVEAISDHLLNDDVSPGEVDDDEAAWLISAVEGDGQVDGVERTLLEAIRGRVAELGTTLPASLQAKLTEWGI
jgi:uncharacterized membrane protein YebE (DUF533 family)